MTISLQEQFDLVVAQQRKQGKPAMEQEQCSLLTKDGCKCAIGGQLSDKELQICNAGAFYENFNYARQILVYNHGWNMLLLDKLRHIHDEGSYSTSDEPKKWLSYCESAWKKLAEVEGLQYSSI